MPRTEPLLRRVSALNNLYNSGTQGFNRWDVVGQDTHITSSSGNVDLDNISGGEDSL